MDKIVKFIVRKPLSVDEENNTVLAVVSDETLDRYQEIILASAWEKGLKFYKKHPVLLSSHNYDNLTSQIGYAEDIYVDRDNKALVAKFKYFVGQGNDEADWGFFLAKNGLAAYSVGFKPRPNGTEVNDYDDEDVRSGKKPIRVYKDVELLEISQVVVPANPSALQKSIDAERDEDIKEYKMNVKSIIEKGVIPYKKYPLAPKDTEWDGPAEVAKATVEDLKEMCAVIVGDEDNKTSYKLPHHLVDGYKTVWRAVVNAAARLNQTDMPKEYVEGVKKHLAKHYEDFGEVAPWEKQDDASKDDAVLEKQEKQNIEQINDILAPVLEKIDALISNLGIVIDKIDKMLNTDYLVNTIAEKLKTVDKNADNQQHSNVLEEIMKDIGDILKKYE